MRMTSERKAETRERILAAAGALFRSHGIDAVGVDAIMHRGRADAWRLLRAFRVEGGAGGRDGRRRSLARSAARWERISEEADAAAALARIVESLSRSGARRRGGARLRADHAGPRDGAAARGAAGDHRLDPPDARCAGALPARAATAAGAGDAVQPWSAPSCWRDCATTRVWPMNSSSRRAMRRVCDRSS